MFYVQEQIFIVETYSGISRYAHVYKENSSSLSTLVVKKIKAKKNLEETG